MNTSTIKSQLAKYDAEKVEKYINYLNHLKNEKTKDKKTNQWVDKNPWVPKRSDVALATYYKNVADDGLDFDGKHITLQSTGVSYDYVAFKNKMLLVYPESLVDVQLVHKGDDFAFKKISGKVEYTHKINDPFGNPELSGCYCVIKNNRGEFLTMLSMSDIAKHRKVAKTDYIWDAWFDEMVIKTVIKKACKTHFQDIFQTMETLDNEQNDLEQSLEISIETKKDLENIKAVPELVAYFEANKNKNAGILQYFTTACTKRKEAIVKELSENEGN